MAHRRAGWRGYGLAVDIPDSAAERLRRLRKPTATPSPTQGALELSPDLPALHVKARDGRSAISFLGTGDPNLESLREYDPTGDLAEQVAQRHWYHTIELPGGVVTPGDFDHRALVPHYGLPRDLTGKRALDVATFDGFWAFEMERRGAAVTAADLDYVGDIDLPPGARVAFNEMGLGDRLPPVGGGFALAHAARESSVKRVATNVYDLSPERVGTFDFVHVADLLLHLRSPVEALAKIRSVTTGEALIVDCFDAGLPGGDDWGPTVRYLGGWYDVTWWLPSLDALAQMVLDAGFSSVSLHRTYRLARTFETHGYWRAALRATV